MSEYSNRPDKLAGIHPFNWSSLRTSHIRLMSSVLNKMLNNTGRMSVENLMGAYDWPKGTHGASFILVEIPKQAQRPGEHTVCRRCPGVFDPERGLAGLPAGPSLMVELELSPLVTGEENRT